MRQIIKFNDNWHFWKDTSDVNIQDGGENITLPHTWNGVDGQDGGNNYFRGSCVLPVCSAWETFISQKKNSKNHGIGMRSIKKIVKNYNGSLDTYYKDDEILICKKYHSNKELFLNKFNNPLHITLDVDKDVFINKITDDKVINITLVLWS